MSSETLTSFLSGLLKITVDASIDDTELTKKMLHYVLLNMYKLFYTIL